MGGTSAKPIPNIEFFRDVFNASPIGIAVENLDGQLLFVNPALCSILGFTEDELLDKHCVQFSPPEDAEKDWVLFQKLRAGSIDHYQLEKRYFRRDGSLVWGSLSLSLLNSRPSPLVLAMVEDITEKKRAEEALRESEERFRLAAQAGKMYSFEWDVATDKVVRSSEHVEILDVKEPLNITHQQFMDKVHPDDRPKLAAAIAELSPQNPTCNVSYRVLISDGAVVWIKSSGHAFFDGQGRMLRLVGMVADITDQKLAEESLRASEERLRLAQKVAGIGTFERNIRTGVNTWTPEMESMYGLPPGSFGRTRAAFENLIHPDDRARVVKLVDEALKTGRQMSGEWRVIWPDGSVHWIAGYWQALMDESGEPSRVIGVDMDITDRKRAEEALRDSEERFRLAAYAGRMYAYTWDAITDVIVRSGNASDVLGSTGGAPLTRQQTLARVHPDDRETFNASVNQHTLEHPDVQISYRMLRPDGSVVWVEKTAHAMFDEQGRPLRVVGMVADITERKRAEETLRESEERFRLVANTAPVMIWMSGVDKKPTYFNQLWMDFTGLSEAELRNGLVGIVHAEDYQRCHDVYCRGFDRRQPFRKECRLRRYDGQYRWMLDIGVPRFHKDGSFAGYIGSCVDVTDHKLAEDVLSNMSRKLVEAQEQERARIARELHDDVAQRLAMLSIDLDQAQQVWPDLPSEVLSYMVELRRRTRQISTDVQSLSHDLHSSQLEHLGVVTGIKSWCREFGERQRIQIDFEHDVQGTFSPEIDLCLFRVLQEALHNAAKHSGAKHVKIALTEDSGEIHLLIRDFGKGFDLEAAKHGRGLGLTSMQERVRLVKGIIEIQSKPMDGTAIHVRIPFWSESNSQRAAG
jgi:PAS domain S-box-containing protein